MLMEVVTLFALAGAPQAKPPEISNGAVLIQKGGGKVEGSIRKNPFQPNRYDVYNSDGKNTQRIERNPFQRNRYDVRDAD